MDPEERDELLRGVDEEFDDSPKGRAMKDTIKVAFARTRREEQEEETDE
jgi:hypothetical protein